MGRLWDTPEFWVRSEADEMLREMPESNPGAVADSFERSVANYDGDPGFATAVVGELRRRAAAGVRFLAGLAAGCRRSARLGEQRHCRPSRRRDSVVRMAASADLFDAPILPGLDYREGIITETEERELIGRIDGAELSPFKFQQWTGKRLTHSYGWSYDFETGRFSPTDPIPDWLMPLKTRAARFTGLGADDLIQALLIRYDPGAGIGWHRDRPVFEDVIGISLGTSATMRFRRRAGAKFERASAPLAPRSVYHLSGEARHGWEHSIVAMETARWSITFRSFARPTGLPRADAAS